MFSAYFQEIKDFFSRIFKSRILVLTIILCILSGILVLRLFVLQIINGDNYLNNFTLTIEKERSIPGARGIIYDCNGEPLAYNELAYTVCIEDNGTYDTLDEKNKVLNDTISKLVKIIENNKDALNNDFYIQVSNEGKMEYTVSGTQKLRFLADIFGYAKIDSLKYNSSLGCNEAEATAEQIYNLLADKKHYNLSEDVYPREECLKIMAVRYAVSQNSYQKYLMTTVAGQVSPDTVAEVMESINDLQGVSITEGSVRKYNSSVYMAPIIGYTGKISSEELQEYNKEDSNNYALNDVIGKSGIEQYMEEHLRGKKGYEKVYVDSLGKILQVADRVEASSGDNVYLTIDSKLQEAAYRIIEQRLAGIILSKLINELEYHMSEDTKASDILIPIGDAYFSLVDNNIIDLNHFGNDNAGPTEKKIQEVFEVKYKSALSSVEDMLKYSTATYNSLGSELESYCNFIINQLFSEGYLSFDRINTSDEMYVNWKNGTVATKEYLLYTISKGWLDITKFPANTTYSDANEIYDRLTEHIMDSICTTVAFKKLVYKVLIKTGQVSGNALCLILYEQNVLPADDPDKAALEGGAVNAFNFMVNKITKLEITPGMLALDPCSASIVITDPSNGNTLACVSYPGYDNNKLANKVDNKYYYQLSQSKAYPLYNHATQERTAPGSTFKMVTATAGLSEGIITPETEILDKGVFEMITPSPKCWVYPSTHGSINVSEAIRDSCNYFFYSVGYDMSLDMGTYNAEKGIDILKKYASEYGLAEKSGLEMNENEPAIATDYPVTAAIGQSNHNFTVSQLARYVMTVANRGKCYSLTLIDKVCDKDGKTLVESKPNLGRELTDVSSSTWNAIRTGMHMDIDTLTAFKSLKETAAGKTGTAEEAANRGNHALFVCFAPYENPKIASAVRIPHGYSSSNAVDITAEVLEYYFNQVSLDDIRKNGAIMPGGQVVGD